MAGFTAEQLNQIRTVFREELADAGLRLDGPDHQDAAKEDFRFVRRLRLGMEGMSAKIGWAIIAAVLGGVIFIFDLGIKAWKAAGGP